MAKLPENSDSITKISASQILNYLKRNNLTNEVFVEILSDLKNKQGFKNLRKMVEDLIHAHEGQLYNPRTETIQRASIINEICTVAFTIDTIFPNVLRMKFQNQFPMLVHDILQELKSENKISSFVPYLPQSFDDSFVTSPRARVVVNSEGHQSGPSTEASKISNINSLQTEAAENSTSANQNVREDDQEDDFDTPKENISVSSVHTSELSSFDDTISVSSDAELTVGEKKRFSIKEIQQLSKSDRIKSWFAQNTQNNKPKAKRTKNRKRKNVSSLKENNIQRAFSSETKLSSSDESGQSGSPKESSLSAKVLPRRTRKPNSKYVSESIVCPISAKHKKAQKNKIDISEPLTPVKKQKIIHSESENEELNIIPGTPKKDQQTHSSNVKSIEKSISLVPATSGVFKPFASVMPLTSRKTAPKTLFSTQNLK